MQISWWTFALQIVNFLILVWLLQRFLYRPVRDILEKRKQLSMQAFAEADKAKQEAEAMRRHYEEARGALAEERQEMLDAAHRSIESDRAKILDEARDQAETLVKSAHESIAQERVKTLEGLENDIANLAVKLAGKLLDNLGASIASDVFLERAEEALTNLPKGERRRLERDLASNGARVVVVTAAPLNAGEQKTWKTRLEADVGRTLEVAFDVDPKLLGGAAVHFPHTVISFAWADQLHDAKQALLSGNHEKPS